MTLLSFRFLFSFLCFKFFFSQAALKVFASLSANDEKVRKQVQISKLLYIEGNLKFIHIQVLKLRKR